VCSSEAHSSSTTPTSATASSQVKNSGTVIEANTYDLNLNRTSRQVGAQAETATYDAQDHLIQRGNVTYTYDSDGSLIRRGTDSFSYAADGALLSATVSGQTITYGYDGLRRLVSRTDASGTHQYRYGNQGNDLQVTASRDAAGTVTTYTYDPGGHLVARSGRKPLLRRH
jgi:YD repeat-containing protein